MLWFQSVGIFSQLFLNSRRKSPTCFSILEFMCFGRFPLICFCLCFYEHRMSAEMVACIAVESLSILEKMHSRGYVNPAFDNFIHFLVYLSFLLRFLTEFSIMTC